jgi:hypothetical protein
MQQQRTNITKTIGGSISIALDLVEALSKVMEKALLVKSYSSRTDLTCSAMFSLEWETSMLGVFFSAQGSQDKGITS